MCVLTTAESRAKVWYQLNVFKTSVAYTDVRFKAAVLLLLLIHCLLLLPYWGFCAYALFCYAIVYVHSSFGSILMWKREREPVALL